MPSLIAPGDSPPDQSRLSRRKRRWLIAGVITVLLVPGLYWMENYSGRRALAKVVAEYEADSDSLDPAMLLPGTVSSDQNFCATPLLDGIMEPYGDSSEAGTANKKRANLSSLLPSRPRGPYKRPAASSGFTFDPWLAVQAKQLEWGEFRAFLPHNTPFTPPADEPSDLRAVYRALDAFKPALDELTSAVSRPHAVFTPQAIQRIDDWTRLPHSLSSELQSLSSLLLLRARAAATLGNADETARLSGVLWRLARACRAECEGSHFAMAHAMELKWARAAREVTTTSEISDSVLAKLLEQPGAHWSVEDDLRREWRSAAALHLAQWKLPESKSGRRFLFEPFDGEGRGKLREAMQLYGPIGWHEQNLARILHRVGMYGLRPLKNAGFYDLPAAMTLLQSEIAESLASNSPYEFSRGDILNPDTAAIRVHHAIRLRLALLTLAMERYRLKHGRYPGKVHALMPDCISAIPSDIDGAPLRIVTSPDGASAVIYSIGWNLTDDWHGVIPLAFKESEEANNADWPLALPFPPLPPP